MSQADHLHQSLDQLHRDLESTDALDGESRAQLRQLVGEIQAKLAEPETESAPGNRGSSDRLQEMASQLESSNPSLYNALTRLINTLSEMGI